MAYDKRLIGIDKERLVVGQIRKWLPSYPIVMLSGPRKVGKTIALLQIAANPGYDVETRFIDCSDGAAPSILSELMTENCFTGILLLDEFHLLEDAQDWLLTFHNCLNDLPTFKVVITGSVAAQITFLAQRRGGGRNRLLHLPVLTYLEYLHFTCDIPYDTDLSLATSEASFKDYMMLKNLRGFEMAPIDEHYVKDAGMEIALAKRASSYTTALLNSNEITIQHALLLLAYRLIDAWGFDKTFASPPIASRETGAADVAHNLRQRDAFDGSRLAEAVRASLTREQIQEALRYLLWNDLAYCNFAETDIEANLDTQLLASLLLGKDLSSEQLDSLFTNRIQICVVSPMFYSLITEELWEKIRECLKEHAREHKPLFIKLARIMRNRDIVSSDPHLLGNWVEAYLRGAYALRSATPMITSSFVTETQREIDIARGGLENILVEVAVKQEEKKEKDVNFQLAYTGKEKCFLTTKSTIERVVWQGVPILRIPYHMLAAHLDRDELPSSLV